MNRGQRVDSAVWWRLARSPSVVRRALRYAVGVGALLIAINHGDAIVRKELSMKRLVQMLLTLAVPYSVSTASSVGAMRDFGPCAERPSHTTDASEEKAE